MEGDDLASSSSSSSSSFFPQHRFDGLSSLSSGGTQNDNDLEVEDADVVRQSFMPGILSTVARGVRQPFKPVVAPCRRRKKGAAAAAAAKGPAKTLGPKRPKLGQVIVSKFLSGRTDFLAARPLLHHALSSQAENTEEEEDGGDDQEEEAAPEFRPHEPLVLYEPTVEEREAGAEEVDVPPLLCQWLRPHQREGVQFVFECVYGMKDYAGVGAILADDMGLGKTLQSLTVMYTMLKRNDAKRANFDLGVAATAKDKRIAKRAVVVCPCSLVKNWEAEFEKWINTKATRAHQRVECMALAATSRKTVEAMLDEFLSPSNRYDVLVISYETFRAQYGRFVKKDRALAKSRTSPNGCIDLLICDEAHRLKNEEAQTSTALGAVACRRRILLSGTPMQNDLVEFYAMVNFTNPSIFGSKENFVKQYERPILRGREPDATDAHKRIAANAQKDLSTISDKFIIRRMNRLNAQHLPPKLTQVVCCALTEPQRLMYTYLLAERDKEHATRGSVKDSLGYVQQLQKLCNHPAILLDAKDPARTAKLRQVLGLPPQDDAALLGRRGRVRPLKPPPLDPGLSGKMRVLRALMKELFDVRKERIVVVSVFMTTLDLIEQMCEQHGWPSCKLGGSTPAKKRKQFNDQFNDPASNYFAFLLSSKAGGCGLNLIGGSRLVMFDLDWNPATDKQAAARCWRDGQKFQCFTYRFVSTGTLEERMLQRQLSKEGLQNVIEDKDQVNCFATDDLKRLFYYRPTTVSELHDELQCKECRGKHAAKKARTGDGGDNAIGLAASARCLDALTSTLFALPCAEPFLKPLLDDSTVRRKDAFARNKKAIDLSQITFKLQSNAYTKISEVVKDLKAVPRAAKKLWDEGDAQFSAADLFAVEIDPFWAQLVPELMAANATERAAAGAEGQPTHDGSPPPPPPPLEIEEEQLPFKKQQYPLPKEEDLNNWSHHSSVATIEDPVFKKAMRKIPDAVTFVFGMYQDWDLIQLDMKASAEEMKRKSDEEKTDSAEELRDEQDDDDKSRASKRSRRRKGLSDATNNKTF
ncbi:hypothetical protein CTAYLR_003158 [Chrysophaeum taylorii]|uniref:Uncharacterized protein n=1 Tax=Chrysophaeum taylorii TaxID=2483200 RepID=A0AAD7UQ40_9STRA|nr:hypothetical protein CTAYLR_003158 [Chrysophaeum taylorii]